MVGVRKKERDRDILGNSQARGRSMTTAGAEQNMIVGEREEGVNAAIERPSYGYRVPQSPLIPFWKKHHGVLHLKVLLLTSPHNKDSLNSGDRMVK